MVGANLKSGSAIIPFDYPLYKQCDPRWGNHIMEVQTICAVGCLMSSTSMAIAGKHVSVAKSLSTPDTLNTFLRDNKGYTGGDDMDEAVVPEVNPAHISWPADGMHATNDIPVATIQAHLKAGESLNSCVHTCVVLCRERERACCRNLVMLLARSCTCTAASLVWGARGRAV